MSYGILVRDAAGAPGFSSDAAYVKFTQRISYTLTAVSNWVLTLSVPGILGDGTWFGVCYSINGDIHYIKQITSGQVTIHSPYGYYVSGAAANTSGYLTLMRLS